MVAPLLQRITYGSNPPEIDAEAVPEAEPQIASFLVISTEGPPIELIVAVAISIQLFASVTVKVYWPAMSPLMAESIDPLLQINL